MEGNSWSENPGIQQEALGFPCNTLPLAATQAVRNVSGAGLPLTPSLPACLGLEEEVRPCLLRSSCLMTCIPTWDFLRQNPGSQILRTQAFEWWGGGLTAFGIGSFPEVTEHTVPGGGGVIQSKADA